SVPTLAVFRSWASPSATSSAPGACAAHAPHRMAAPRTKSHLLAGIVLPPLAWSVRETHCDHRPFLYDTRGAPLGEPPMLQCPSTAPRRGVGVTAGRRRWPRALAR